jgi:hypothetical protein
MKSDPKKLFPSFLTTKLSSLTCCYFVLHKIIPHKKTGAETMNMFSIYAYWITPTTVYTVIFLKIPAIGDGLHELLKLTQNC